MPNLIEIKLRISEDNLDRLKTEGHDVSKIWLDEIEPGTFELLAVAHRDDLVGWTNREGAGEGPS